MATEALPHGEIVLWCRRQAKRLAAVRAVKASKDYTGCAVRPATPDPLDRSVSKRCWEKSVQEWRQALRSQARTSAALSTRAAKDAPAHLERDVDAFFESVEAAVEAALGELENKE